MEELKKIGKLDKLTARENYKHNKTKDHWVQSDQIKFF